jgi:hypothetical protein
MRVLLLLLLAGCQVERDPSQVLVAVDTDYDVPQELDAIRIDVIGPTGDVRQANGAIASRDDLPATLGIVHRGGPLGPLLVTATGMRDGEDRVSRRARLDFPALGTVVLYLTLFKDCARRECEEDETCDASGCRPIDVSPGELMPWAGVLGPPASDAGPEEMDAGTPPPPPPEEDAGTPPPPPPDPCAMCTAPPNAEAICEMEMCTFRCADKFGDCDGEPVNGCETDLRTSAEHCNECGRVCRDGPCCDAHCCRRDEVCCEGDCRRSCDDDDGDD